VIVSVKKLKSTTAKPTSFPSEFDRIFQDNWSRVYGVIYRIVGDHTEAEDLALETFIRLHHRPPRKGGNLAGWLYRVATNLGLNALRSQDRRAAYENKAGLIVLEGAAPLDPSIAIEDAEELKKVRMALSKIKKRSTKILILRYSGFSYTEIASAIGVSSSSVGTLLTRAEREFEKHYRALD